MGAEYKLYINNEFMGTYFPATLTDEIIKHIYPVLDPITGTSRIEGLERIAIEIWEDNKRKSRIPASTWLEIQGINIRG